jgi:hypothetical protein
MRAKLGMEFLSKTEVETFGDELHEHSLSPLTSTLSKKLIKSANNNLTC